MDINLLNKIITIFIITVIGYMLRKKEIFNKEIEKAISFIIINIAIPSLTISSGNHVLEKDSIKIIITILLGALIYHAIAIIISSAGARVLSLEEKKKNIFISLSTFSNVAFIGYPIISVFLPKNGVFFAAFFVTIFNLIFYSYGVIKISGNKKISLRSILGSPPTIASIIMLLIFILQINLPPAIQETFITLGNLSTPLSILVVGSMLGGFAIKDLFSERSIFVASFFRLILIPSIVFVILKMLPIDIVSKTILLVMSGLPPANTTAIVARVYESDSEYATKGVLQGVILFLFTAFYLSFLVNKL